MRYIKIARKTLTVCCANKKDLSQSDTTNIFALSVATRISAAINLALLPPDHILSSKSMKELSYVDKTITFLSKLVATASHKL